MRRGIPKLHAPSCDLCCGMSVYFGLKASEKKEEGEDPAYDWRSPAPLPYSHCSSPARAKCIAFMTHDSVEDVPVKPRSTDALGTIFTDACWMPCTICFEGPCSKGGLSAALPHPVSSSTRARSGLTKPRTKLVKFCLRRCCMMPEARKLPSLR